MFSMKNIFRVLWFLLLLITSPLAIALGTLGIGFVLVGSFLLWPMGWHPMSFTARDIVDQLAE